MPAERALVARVLSPQVATERAEVVEDLKLAIDFAEELGCNRISTCPLNEGHDYSFEMDYERGLTFF